MSIVNQIPKSEDGYGVLYKTKSNEYVISQNTKKEKFTLWKKLKNGYEKVGTANSPTDLYKKCEP